MLIPRGVGNNTRRSLSFRARVLNIPRRKSVVQCKEKCMDLNNKFLFLVSWKPSK